ncbi:hypothetical protein CSX04_08396 [Burkholderia cepacia]|nr:hypothetical protein CSX04_08396 [Burkholderia cepacia]
MQLIGSQSPVFAQSPGRVDISVMRKIGLVGLLYPERDRLRNQRLERDVVRERYAIDHEQVIASDARMSDDLVGNQHVSADRRIQFENTSLLG